MTKNPERQPPRVPPTDGELLMRFRRHRDGDAFTELVQKHGPVVWSVCRQVLGSHHDAEDAFQATFLILARHSSSGYHVTSLAGWLYKVAYRTAVRTRRNRRDHEEIQAIEELRSADDVFASISRKELQSVLHDELTRMPERYQAPLILCYLQGKSRTEAAEELDCTDASVKAKLARGRNILRSRLIRRGLALSAAVTATSSAVVEAADELPPMLTQTTVEGCIGSVSDGKTAAVSTSAQSLATEGVRTMILSKAFKIAAVFLGVTTLCIVGIMGLKDAGASGSPETSELGVVMATGGGEPGSVEDGILTVALGGFQTPTSAQKQSVFKSAAEAPDANSETSTIQDGSAPSSQVGELPFQHAILQARAAFLQTRADVLRLKAQAKEMESEAARRQEDRKDELLKRARELNARADARMFRAEADVAAEEAALSRRKAGTFQSGNALTISESDIVQILVIGTLPESPIAGAFPVEPAGTVPLGPAYGRVTVAGMTLEEAEKAIRLHLVDKGLVQPQVQVTYLSSALPDNLGFRTRLMDEPIESAQLTAGTATSSEPKRLTAKDIIHIRVEGTPSDRPINGFFRLESSGTVPLGPGYGRIPLLGLTIEEAQDRLKVELSKLIRNVEVWVTEGDFPQGHPARESEIIDTLMKEVEHLRTEVSQLRSSSETGKK